MRQAGRYHRHYQRLKEKHTFLELCKIPELAAEVTFGPLEEFGFDAAILFSDLLFPLEAMGLGLSYNPGPKLDHYLTTTSDYSRISGKSKSIGDAFDFQNRALHLIRKGIGAEKGLIGFVGGPFTLFVYATDGSHQGDLNLSQKGLTDGRWYRFLEEMHPILLENMCVQAAAPLDALAIFDTAAGEVSLSDFKTFLLPALRRLLEDFKSRFPNVPLIYYSKGTNSSHWRELVGLPIACLGIDEKAHLPEVLGQFGSQIAIQGNFPSSDLLLDKKLLEPRIRSYLSSVKSTQSEKLSGWISGLGHGVLKETPEENVHLFLKIFKETFA